MSTPTEADRERARTIRRAFVDAVFDVVTDCPGLENAIAQALADAREEGRLEDLHRNAHETSEEMKRLLAEQDANRFVPAHRQDR